jgi:hypothetical protein
MGGPDQRSAVDAGYRVDCGRSTLPVVRVAVRATGRAAVVLAMTGAVALAADAPALRRLPALAARGRIKSLCQHLECVSEDHNHQDITRPTLYGKA